MELEKERAISNQKQGFHRYLFLITIIISSMLISGSIGYTASQMRISNSVGDTTEISTMKNRVNEARNNSLKVIETELPKIISEIEEYNQDVNLLVEKVEELKGNLAFIRDSIDKIGTAFKLVKGVNTFVDLPIVGNISTNLNLNISTNLALAKNQLNEIDSIIVELDNLTVLKQEMKESHQKLNLLYEEYQKEKSIEHLLQIEQELNSNLIYQIEELRKASIETSKLFELSSSVLTAINSIKDMGKNTLDAIQFWKENEGNSVIGKDIKKSLEKDAIVKIQKLPSELAQRSKSSIASINNVQRELQTIKTAQLISSE
ncbi:hypothetical protein [Bacillus pinisoli]|uniref:hypothetical protein n=1 Tax=Bacillus pinisoli TaxID=2901866 RepID=UPI001FF62240|nr:hypothetical protein [Bacillus pinisoli]